MKLTKIEPFKQAYDYFYNNTKSRDCGEFFIPFNDFSKLYFYIDLGTNVPSSVNLFLLNNENGVASNTTYSDYIIAYNGSNYYAVFTGVQSNGLTQFALTASVMYLDMTTAEYTTDLFQYNCDAKLITACYGAKYGLFEGYYDLNGIYYGYPEVLLSGNNQLKYSHAAYLTNENDYPQITIDSKKTYTNNIVNNTVAGSTVVYSGLVTILQISKPYAAYIESIFARGVINYDGQNVVVSDIEVSNECCYSHIQGSTKYTETIEFSCNCEENFDCLPPSIDSVTPFSTYGLVYYSGGTNVQYSEDGGSTWIDTNGSPFQTPLNSMDTEVNFILRSMCDNLPSVNVLGTFTTNFVYGYLGGNSLYSSSLLACNNAASNRPYFRDIPVIAVGMVLYDDINLITPFNGGGQWIAVSICNTVNPCSAFQAIQVDVNGVILATANC